MPKNVLLIGGSGFIGKRIALKLKSLEYNVTVLTRDIAKTALSMPYIDELIEWSDDKIIFEAMIAGFDIIINLAGAGIADRAWTKEYKEKIFNSRILNTKKIVSAINNIQTKPSLLINASAIGFYGDRADEMLSETSEKGNGFLSEVCSSWEMESQKAKDIRVVNPRFGIVLDNKEGALPKMANPFKYLIGGAIGSGRQWMSWIVIDDLVESIIKIIEDESFFGPVNIVSPNPIRNIDFAKALGKALGKPSIIKTPAILIKLIFQEKSSILLYSQRVEPEKLNKSNFIFKYSSIEIALKDLLNA